MKNTVKKLDPNKAYAKSQTLIIITLIFLAFCVFSLYFLLPTIVLTLCNLFRPHLTLITFVDGKKYVVKASHSAWHNYRKENHISWFDQWDLNRITYIVGYNTKNNSSPAQVIKDTTENTKKEPSKAVKNLNSHTKPAIPRNIAPLPKLTLKIDTDDHVMDDKSTMYSQETEGSIKHDILEDSKRFSRNPKNNFDHNE